MERTKEDLKPLFEAIELKYLSEKNRSKGDPMIQSRFSLHSDLQQEVWELWQSISFKEAILEAADVALFAFFMANKMKKGERSNG